MRLLITRDTRINVLFKRTPCQIEFNNHKYTFISHCRFLHVQQATIEYRVNYHRRKRKYRCAKKLNFSRVEINSYN